MSGTYLSVINLSTIAFLTIERVYMLQEICIIPEHFRDYLMSDSLKEYTLSLKKQEIYIFPDFYPDL